MRIDADKHSWSKEELITYDNASIAEQDKRGRLIAAEKKGKLEGKREGKLEVKEKVVKRCWEKNMAIADIAEISDLTIEEVEEIIKMLQNK